MLTLEVLSQYFSDMSQKKLLDIVGLFSFLFLTRNKYFYAKQSKGTCNFEVFDSRSIMASRSESGCQDVWIMEARQIFPSLFALLGSDYALVNKDWLQISLTLLESVHVCKG